MQKRRLRGDLIVAFQYLKTAYKQDQLFTQLGNDRTREKGFKLKGGSFRLAITGKNSLRGWWGAWTCYREMLWMAVRLELDALWGLFQSKSLYRMMFVPQFHVSKLIGLRQIPHCYAYSGLSFVSLPVSNNGNTSLYSPNTQELVSWGFPCYCECIEMAYLFFETSLFPPYSSQPRVTSVRSDSLLSVTRNCSWAWQSMWCNEKGNLPHKTVNSVRSHIEKLNLNCCFCVPHHHLK